MSFMCTVVFCQLIFLLNVHKAIQTQRMNVLTFKNLDDWFIVRLGSVRKEWDFLSTTNF